MKASEEFLKWVKISHYKLFIKKVYKQENLIQSMAKKAIKKSYSVKNHIKSNSKIPSKKHLPVHGELKIEKVLVENFVSLQKVMTHLSVKFDNLTKQISKLLELFEISAKALAEKDFDLEKGGKDKKITEKIDNLLEQNKTIARGLTLVHEKIPEQKKFSYPPVQSPQQMQQPQISRPPVEMEGYQKSISSGGSPESPATQLPKK